MSLPYGDAEQISEVQEYLRNGGDEEKAAAYLQCRVDDLPQLLAWPQWKRLPSQRASEEFDLFAIDRLDAVL